MFPGNFDFASAPRFAPAAKMTSNGIDKRGPICIVDDDDWVCDSLSVLLDTQGFAVRAYSSGAEFLADERQDEAKCLVIDQHMPGLEGLGVIAELRRKGLAVPAILITGRLDPGLSRRADQLGVLAILEKPFAVGRLVELVRRALGPHNCPQH